MQGLKSNMMKKVLYSIGSVKSSNKQLLEKTIKKIKKVAKDNYNPIIEEEELELFTWEQIKTKVSNQFLVTSLYWHPLMDVEKITHNNSHGDYFYMKEGNGYRNTMFSIKGEDFITKEWDTYLYFV
jgi:hypothetical protein